MPKSVRDLVAGLMIPGEAGLPTIQDFSLLDFEKIATDLQLDTRAEVAGRAGQPLPQAGGPDTAELEIQGYIERLARKAHEVYLSQIDQYEVRIRKSLISPDLRVQIEAASTRALTDLK